jgi:hypothetical protein
MVKMINTCALYGTATYTNSWIGINVLVLLVCLLIVAVIYSLSSIFPVMTKQKMVGAARSELTQILLSALIIAILIGFSLTAAAYHQM